MCYKSQHLHVNNTCIVKSKASFKYYDCDNDWSILWLPVDGWGSHQLMKTLRHTLLQEPHTILIGFAQSCGTKQKTVFELPMSLHVQLQCKHAVWQNTIRDTFTSIRKFRNLHHRSNTLQPPTFLSKSRCSQQTLSQGFRLLVRNWPGISVNSIL